MTIPTRPGRTRGGEAAVEPDLAIIDAHHHLWAEERPHQARSRYGRDEFARDAAAGHRIVGSVFVECGARYRSAGPPHLRPVGETEWIVGERRDDGLLSGLVPHADLFLGAEAGVVIDAHVQAGGELVKGIRHVVAWDAAPDVYRPAQRPPRHALLDPRFRRGVAELERRSLVFETWLYFPQIDDLLDLAATFPDLVIVLDHLGGPVRTGSYADDPAAARRAWRRQVARLAACPNVYLKLGGIGFHPFRDPALDAEPAAGSERIAEVWGADVAYCIDLLTPQRCMFESNFPVDGALTDYVTLWNAYQRMTRHLSPDDRRWLFAGTASAVYRLDSR